MEAAQAEDNEGVFIKIRKDGQFGWKRRSDDVTGRQLNCRMKDWYL